MKSGPLDGRRVSDVSQPGRRILRAGPSVLALAWYDNLSLTIRPLAGRGTGSLVPIRRQDPIAPDALTTEIQINGRPATPMGSSASSLVANRGIRRKVLFSANSRGGLTPARAGRSATASGIPPAARRVHREEAGPRRSRVTPRRRPRRRRLSAVQRSCVVGADGHQRATMPSSPHTSQCVSSQWAAGGVAPRPAA